MTVSFTDRELDLMAVLWEKGSGKVREVKEALEDDLAYTTVLTTLRNMEEKGYVRHEEEGRAYRYYPEVPREAAGRTALRRLIATMFGGSRERLLMHLVSDEEISEEELRRLSQVVEEELDEEGDR
jgi:predicted transcriptional regulator